MGFGDRVSEHAVKNGGKPWSPDMIKAANEAGVKVAENFRANNDKIVKSIQKGASILTDFFNALKAKEYEKAEAILRENKIESPKWTAILRKARAEERAKAQADH